MVQSTGAANAQYLQDIVLGGVGINRFSGETPQNDVDISLDDHM